MNIWKDYEYYNHDISNEIQIGDIIKFQELPDEIVISKLDYVFVTSSIECSNKFFITKYPSGYSFSWYR